MSDPNGVESPPLTSVERVPLRSLQNDMQHMHSTPSSKRQSRTLASSDAFKTTTRDDSNQPPKEKGNSSFNVDKVAILNASTACSGDITFKSFTCAGGEIEILDHSDMAEDSIVLPTHQPSNTWLQGDATISDSMIIHESGNDHMDHAYCNPEEGDNVVMNHTVPPTEHSNSFPSLVSTNMDAQQEPTLVNGCRGAECDVTYKSFICDGGEVEVLDATACPLSETIPLPKEELVDQHPSDSVSMSIVVEDCGDQDHTDHPYSSKECGFSYSFAQNPKLTDGQTDITLKSFVCTGGEVEVSDGTTVAEETIPLPSVQLGMSNYLANDESIINQSELAANQIVEPCNGHLEHCYFNAEHLISPSPSGDLEAPQEPLPSSAEAPQLEEHVSLVADGGNTDGAFDSLGATAGDVNPTDAIVLLEKPVSLLEDPAEVGPPSHKNSRAVGVVQSHDLESQHRQPCALKSDESIEPAAVIDSVITDASIPVTNIEEIQDASHVDLSPAEMSAVYCAFQPVYSPDRRAHEASAQPQRSITVQVKGQVVSDSEVHLRSDVLGCSGAQKDSALGMSSDAPVGSVEKEPAENPSDFMAELPEFPVVPKTLQFEFLSPVVRETPLARIRTYKDSFLAKYLAEGSLLDGEKSLVSPAEKDPSTWPFMGPLESPMPRPQFNSTTLGTRYSCEPPSIVVREVPEQKPLTRHSMVPAAAVPASQEQNGLLDLPLIPNGPLQQQLRQMAEILILASGKMSATAAPFPAAINTVRPAPPPAESHSICVGTSPMKLVDRCFNTSGEFERKRAFSVADGCTATDPLLWNVPPGSLEGLSKRELEQRLRSSMIMVEALVQQLDAARGQQGPPAGPPPSQLRDTLVQTDHTELSQTSMCRDLYMTALGRIHELEMDQSSLQSLIQAVQGTKNTVGMLSADTDTAISTMKQMEQAVREDRCSVLAQYGEMKGLCGRFKESHARMMQKVRDALREREDMRRQMNEAFSAKDAAFSVTEQLRVHCAQQISEMEQSVGCHQELMAALNKAYPEQVVLNQAYVETLNSAFDVLSRTRKDQASLAEELARVRALLKKTVPMLLKLNEKAVDALSDRDRHLLDRDQAVEERQQIQDALQQANFDLQDADQQIGDLNIQATIMSSELGVLREKLSEGEEERAQLERKVTELSATISSTLASYTFLEQALASESTMLQQSRKDHEQAMGKADQLEALLGPSEQRVCELSEALTHSEQQLGLLQGHAHAQAQQLLQLGDTCTQLSSVREMNEFLQMENELVREQIVESEGMFQVNLQGLRERNIQCEDLKGAISRLQLEKASVEADLEATRSRASDTQQSLGEQLVQGVTVVTVQLHKLRGLTNSLHVALRDQNPEASMDGASQARTPGQERRHGSNSFVDDVMVALAAEKEEDEEQDDQQPPQFEGLLSESSAFTRITPAATPKKIQRVEAEAEAEAELGSSGLPVLLPELSSTVSELVSTLDALRQRKDTQLEEMDSTICGLQREQQAAASRHRDELMQLTNQLSRLSGQVEKGNLALQQKTQDEKTLINLFNEVNEARETLNKHKAENLELRRVLQQSQVEVRALRDELRRAGPPSASTAHLMDQKIQLLQEVERLKGSLVEAEQARTKILDKAKRHRMVYQTNEQRIESELRMLDNMVEKARKTLMSIPDVVQNCEELRKLADYIC